MVGTPATCRRSNAAGEAVDARSDLFSAGAVLYELLSGQRAFSGRSYTEIAHHLTQEDMPRLRNALPGASPALCAVVDRALARDPAERFPNAAAMAAALRAASVSTADTAPAEDGTVVLAPSKASASAFGADAISTIERKLAQELGPIAKVLVSSAARTAPSLEALCQTLSHNIASPMARERFMAEALAGTGRRGGAGSTQARSAPPTATPAGAAGPPSALDERDIEQARQELARYLGPIAKVLVRRESAAARTVPALWDRLATHIEHPADRAAFLKRRPSG